MEFSGKTALITGAGTGNGEAIAERLFAGGASVGLVSRRLEPVQSVCRRIDPKGARTLAVEADVRDPKAMEDAVKRIVERFGALDLAVNNAGVTGPAGTPAIIAASAIVSSRADLPKLSRAASSIPYRPCPR